MTSLSLKRHISVTVPDRCMRLGITRQMATSVIDHYWKFFLSVLKIEQYFVNFGETFSNIMTSTPVTISIILNRSQLDARSLIQAERNEKAFKRIQKKMMHARSTLDWSQSNNISCFICQKVQTLAKTLPQIPNFAIFSPSKIECFL